jgi:hypothetical protein
MTLDQYKLKVQSDLDGLSDHIKPNDVKQIQLSIDKAKTTGEFDAISLGLNFHKFRVENREASGK